MKFFPLVADLVSICVLYVYSCL